MTSPILLPSTRIAQPQSELRISPRWANRRVSAVVPQGNGVFDSNGNVSAPNGAGILVGPHVNGIATSSPVASTNTVQISGNTTNTVWDAPTTAFTCFALVRRVGNNPNGNAPIWSNATPTLSPYTAWGFQDAGGTGTLRVEAAPGGTYSSVSAAVGFTNGTLQLIAGSYDGASLTVWIDGVLQGTAAASGTLAYPNDGNRGTALGNFYNYTGAARSFNGEIYLTGLSPFAFSAAEHRELAANPWALFEDEQTYIPFSAATTPVLSSPTMSGITSTGGYPRVTRA